MKIDIVLLHLKLKEWLVDRWANANGWSTRQSATDANRYWRRTWNARPASRWRSATSEAPWPSRSARPPRGCWSLRTPAAPSGATDAPPQQPTSCSPRFRSPEEAPSASSTAARNGPRLRAVSTAMPLMVSLLSFLILSSCSKTG